MHTFKFRTIAIFVIALLGLQGGMFLFNGPASAAEKVQYTAYTVNKGAIYGVQNKATGESIPSYCFDLHHPQPLSLGEGGLEYREGSHAFSNYETWGPNGEKYTNGKVEEKDGRIFVKDQVLRKILFNGHPVNAGGLKEAYGLNDFQFQKATQKAIWSVRDNNQLKLSYNWNRNGEDRVNMAIKYLATGQKHTGTFADGSPDIDFGTQSDNYGAQLKEPDPEFQVEVLNTTAQDNGQNYQRMLISHYSTTPKITFKKVNSLGEPLQGVKLSVNEWNSQSSKPGKEILAWDSANTGQQIDFGELDEEKEYVWVEKQALPGYEKAENIRFKISLHDNGKYQLFTWDNHANAYVNPQFVSSNTSLNMVNLKETVDVSFVKHLADGTPLADAGFSVVLRDKPDVEVASFSSDAQGAPQKVRLEKLGAYTLKEVRVPFLIKRMADVNFTIDEDGKFVADSQRQDVKVEASGNVVLTNEKSTNPIISVNKTDSFANPVSGAKMRLRVDDENIDFNTPNLQSNVVELPDPDKPAQPGQVITHNLDPLLWAMHNVDAKAVQHWDTENMERDLKVFETDSSTIALKDKAWTPAPNFNGWVEYVNVDGEDLVHLKASCNNRGDYWYGEFFCSLSAPKGLTLHSAYVDGQKQDFSQSTPSNPKGFYFRDKPGYDVEREYNNYINHGEASPTIKNHVSNVNTFIQASTNTTSAKKVVEAYFKVDGSVSPGTKTYVSGHMRSGRDTGWNYYRKVWLTEITIPGQTKGPDTPQGMKKWRQIEWDSTQDPRVLEVANFDTAKPDATFILEETAQPTTGGFENYLPKLKFKLNKDKQIEILADSYDLNAVQADGTALEGKEKEAALAKAKQHIFVDPNIPHQVNVINKAEKEPELAVTVKKAKFGGSELAGAKLEILNGFNQVVATITGASESVTLKAGKYVLRETQAPTDYVNARDIRFQITGNNTLEILDNPEQLATVDNATLTLVNHKTTRELILEKQDAEGRRLDGAQFTLTPLGEESTVTPTQLNLSGNQNPATTQLAPGKYRLTETQPPNGYQKVSDAIVDVNTDGTVTVAPSQTEDTITVADDAPNKVIVVNHKEKKTIRLAKVDQDGKPLNGAKLGLYHQDASSEDNLVKTWITQADTPFIDLALTPGQYVLRETGTPLGYAGLNSEVTFNLSDQGTVQLVDDQGVNNALVTVKDNTLVQVTNKQLKTPIVVTKLKSNGDYLAGAQLQIFNEDGKTPAAVWDEYGNSLEGPALVHTSDQQTPWQPYVEPGVYWLKENAAPEGYLSFEPLQFEVATSGAVTILSTSRDDVLANQEFNEVALFDKSEKEKSIQISKIDFAGQDVAGATLVLKRDNKNIFHWLSTAHAPQSVIVEPDVEYTIEETTPPEGLQRFEPVTFSVNTDGVITLKDVTDQRARATGSHMEIVDSYKEFDDTGNQPNTFSFLKTTKDGSEVLPGAVFQIFEWNDGVPGQMLSQWISTKDPHQLSLSDGSYVLVEKVAPYGYISMGQAPFIIIDGKLSLFSDAQSVTSNLVTFDEDKATVTVRNEVDLKDVLISKTALGGKEIAGATIQILRAPEIGSTGQLEPAYLLDEDGKEIAGASWTSTDQAKKVKLQPGRYVFHEEAAPAGYLKVTDVYFRVDTSGNVRDMQFLGKDTENKWKTTPLAQVKDTFGKETTTVAATASSHTLTIVDEEQPHRTIAISKTDLGGSEVEGALIQIFDAPTGDGEQLQPATVYDPDTYAVLDAREENGVQLAKGQWVSANTQRKILMKPGTYVFHEEAAPKGYLAVNDITFIVHEAEFDDATGQMKPARVEVVNVNDNHTPQGDTVFTAPGQLQVVDEADDAPEPSEPVKPELLREVSISKKTSLNAGDELAGAVIQILQAEPVTDPADPAATPRRVHARVWDKASGEEIPRAQWTSTDTAKEIKILPGTYTFVEKYAPNGYQVVTEITFRVDVTGNVSVLKLNGNVAQGAKGKLTVVDQPADPNNPGGDNGSSRKEITVSKESSLDAGKELPGAHIEINNLNGSDARILDEAGNIVPRGAWVSGDTPEVIKIEPGTYVFHEEAAPEGFLAVTDITFVVGEDGSIAVLKAKGNTVMGADGKLTVVDYAKNDPNKPNPDEEPTPKPQEVTISKTASLGAGEELEGAHISIKNLDGTPAQITDADGKDIANGEWVSTTQAQVVKILPGEYLFVENAAPAGYELVTSIQFLVGEDGNVVVQKLNGFEAKGTAGKLNVVDRLIPETIEPGNTVFKDVQFTKASSLKAGAELPGAHIQILLNNAARTPAAVYDEEGHLIKDATWVSSDTAKVIKMKPGVYVFHENAAPAGFDKVTDIVFEIGEDGTVSVIQVDNNTVDADGPHLTVVDRVAPISPDKPEPQNPIIGALAATGAHRGIILFSAFALALGWVLMVTRRRMQE